MLVFHNPAHRLHQGRREMFRGRLVPCVETPERLEQVLAELRRRPVGPVSAPTEPADLDAMLAQIHSPRYLEFLAGAWDEWLALDPANAELDALPSVWPGRGFRHDLLPRNFAARMGLFGFDAGTPVTAGAWPAARAGAGCAMAAARAGHRRRPQCLRADPPAGPPCGRGLLRRLLLPEQFGPCRADAARCRR